MNTFLYIILGMIQGLTEPIPVSSSGHLIIFNAIFNLPELTDLNFEMITNFGSFIAITIFYRKEILKIIKDFFTYLFKKDEKCLTNYRYAWMIAVASIPVGLIGLLLKDKIEALVSVKLVGISLLITAILLFLIKDFKGEKSKENMTFFDAIIVGLFEVIALFPGISRSGATLVGGLYRKLDRETAFNYSFMLYIPVSLGTMLLGVIDLLTGGIESNLIIPYLLSMIAAGIFTYATIGWFKKIVSEGKLHYFIIYCVVIGLFAIIVL